MLALPKFTHIDVIEMTKFEYYDKIRKLCIQHPENKWIRGYYCTCNDYSFWLDTATFNKLFSITYEDS